MNLDNIGVSTLKDSTAFKKIQFFSKTNPTNLFNIKSDFQNSLNQVSQLYLSDIDLDNSYTYGMDRQHTYTSVMSTLPTFSTLLDNNSVEKFFKYNLGTSLLQNKPLINVNRYEYDNSSNKNLENQLIKYTNLLNIPNTFLNKLDFYSVIQLPNMMSVLSNESDSKQYTNINKYVLNSKLKKKLINNFDYLSFNFKLNDNLNPQHNLNSFSNTLFNTETNLKFMDLKSNNMQFLGSERTVRLLNNINSNTYKWNFSSTPNETLSLSKKLETSSNSQNTIYASSKSNWSNYDKYTKLANNII